jgi:hypothetical protein
LDAASFPQKEILHDEFSFATRKWPTTSAARYLAISGFRSGFKFDDVVCGGRSSASQYGEVNLFVKRLNVDTHLAAHSSLHTHV